MHAWRLKAERTARWSMQGPQLVAFDRHDRSGMGVDMPLVISIKWITTP